MNRMMTGLTLMGALLLAAPPSHADIVYSDLGQGGTFSATTGYDVGTIQPLYLLTGASFIPTANFTLTQIDIALVYDEGGPNRGSTVALEKDSNGLPAYGTPLETWYPGSLPLYGSNTLGSADMLTSVGSPVELTSGTRYWLVAEAYLPPNLDLWQQNTVGATDNMASEVFTSSNTNGWSLAANSAAPAFAVFGTPVNPSPVPEPGSLALLLGGLIGLAGLRLRRPA
jgi:hypothetical protein